MKKTRFLFITLLLAALFTVAVSADALVAHITCDNYKDWWYVTDNYYSMNSLDESQVWVDTENQTEGEACISAKENPYFFGSPIYCFEWFMWNTPQSWDIDLDNGYITFDFYTDDPEHCFNASRFEIGFSEMIGALDAHEIEWLLNETGANLKGQVKKGWNTFTLKFSDALIVGNVDFDHVSYIRFFGLNVAEDATFKIDNIRVMTSAYDDADTLVYNSNTIDDPMQVAAKKEAAAREQQKIESGMVLKVDGVPADAVNVLGVMEELTGIWEISENKAETTEATGDIMLVSEKFVAADEAFVFSMDTVLTSSAFSSGGVGPMLITGDIYNPINTGAIILRTDYNNGSGLSNFFSFNSTTVAFGSSFDGPAYAIGDKIHYDLVYDGNYTFYGYTNGELTHICDGKGFTGAYLGLLVWSGTGYFENVTFSNDISLFTGETPVVEEPVVEEPVVEEPVVEEPAVEEPAVEEPVVEEPAVEEPAVEEPVVEEPAVEEPAVEEPAVEEPAVEEPAVEEPAVEEPAVEEPAVEEPAVEEPAVEKSNTTLVIVVIAVVVVVILAVGAAILFKKKK